MVMEEGRPGADLWVVCRRHGWERTVWGGLGSRGESTSIWGEERMEQEKISVE